VGWRYSTDPVPTLGGVADLSPAVVYAVPPDGPRLADVVDDSLFGLSGKLRARFVDRPLSTAFPLLPSTVDRGPGVYPIAADSAHPSFAFVRLTPFTLKRGEKIGRYRMGFWPAELRWVSSSAYENPDGFIEVTQAHQDLRVSQHFRLRDFLTHDQEQVWPKYLVLREELLDKLELVIADLTVRGIPATNVIVMSGFRTPFHNEYGIGGEGGARDSRHQFGDAADIVVDTDGNGRMDDLNFDGRVDTRDIDEVLKAVERVERLYPDLVGGVGRYHGTGPRGPFAHIDVRGYRARWATAVARKAPVRAARAQTAGGAGGCIAAGRSAILCRGSR
jgi:uncharacterized protein YcbK (DUF882 family)